MTDLDTLRDAFAELERRADDADLPERNVTGARRSTRRTAWLLIAASVVAVLAVAGGVAVLMHTGDSSGSPAGAPPNRASDPAASSGWTSPSAVSPSPTGRSGSIALSSPKASSTGLPRNGVELAARLRAVLGSAARLDYDPPDEKEAYLLGRITNTATGATGGFDLQVMTGSPGDDPICEDAAESHCKVRTLSDGSKVSVGREKTQSGGTLILLDLVRRDGANLLLHLSNEGDPKGGGGVLGNQPPFTANQMIAFLRSPRWGS